MNLILFALLTLNSSEPSWVPDQYGSIVTADNPVLYLRFEQSEFWTPWQPSGAAKVQGRVNGTVTQVSTGPAAPEFPLFSHANKALNLSPGQNYIEFLDSAKTPQLDFNNDDAVTIEAWVNPKKVANGGFAYILGKGRTKPGSTNHNYALRLQGKGSTAGLSFLFRSAKNTWHRWSTGGELGLGDGWHHVAVTYRFGKPDSIRGYVDGESVNGTWDMDGVTTTAPLVDDDSLWIGSSMGGQPSSSFDGQLDEIALYRSALSPAQIAKHYRYAYTNKIALPDHIPNDSVLVEIFEHLPDGKSWKFRRAPEKTDQYNTSALGFVELTKKYSKKAIHVDRSAPFLLRAHSKISLAEGDLRILVRARNGARLFLDGELFLEIPFFKILGTAHGTVTHPDRSIAPNIRAKQRGETERIAILKGDGKEHVFLFEMVVGGQSHRPEVGETTVSVSSSNGDFNLLSPTRTIPLTEQSWPEFEREQKAFIATLNSKRRIAAGRQEAKYWRERHSAGKRIARALAPPIPDLKKPGKLAKPDASAIDFFIWKQLESTQQKQHSPIGDEAFLRRIYLDVVGVPPTAQETKRFLANNNSTKRQDLVGELLQDPRWADNWMGYWQDLLAENPNIVNPTLNNTGPFRLWLHESFSDNKPFDRMVTELIMMEGSEYYGGPAGFAIATQNDSPMAAKAHIVSRAFLGIELSCARCHDAPFHDYRQEQLFALAAMLGRKPLTVPASSSVPGGSSELIEVTLEPGTKVMPKWLFDDIVPARIPDSNSVKFVRNENDSREQLAAIITAPTNSRFAQVVVNRLWKRYIGQGIVEPVDDWQHATPSHPMLLDYLVAELISSGYDLKHVASLILSSHLYQLETIDATEVAKLETSYKFHAPVQRRMSAEQLVDSLFAVSGVPFDAGQMAVDIDGARSYKSSLHLGKPRRAWEFASLSNERDRPSLDLPFAKPFVTVMEIFGWQGSRQNPIAERNQDTTLLQPAIVSNGVIGRNVTTLSDSNAITHIALNTQPIDTFIEHLFLQILSRRPDNDELISIRDYLNAGYDNRISNAKPNSGGTLPPRDLVSWSNHLHPEANNIKIQLQQLVSAGHPSTNRLNADWRDRAEDVVWALINSPEFLFIP